MLTDLPLNELLRYCSDEEEPHDFDEFWASTLEEARRQSAAVEFAPHESGMALLDVVDVTFSGWGGQPIKAWLLTARSSPQPLPAVVQFVGYTGGRGSPWQWMRWAVAGYATLVVDNRGQGGGGWATGDTPDVSPYGHSPAALGHLTQGIEHPSRHYYRRLITDAVLAVDAVRAADQIDPARVAVAGTSQGGGLALAVAGLRPDVSALIAEVPFLCHFRRASEITDSGPYAQIGQWLRGRRGDVQEAFATLAYFDGVNFARRAKCPALFSVGLMDATCPPSTVFAAYNAYAGPKDIAIHQYNGHEGGAEFDIPRHLELLQRAFSSPANEIAW